jgi:thymidylate synthase (FAD)
MEIKVLDHGYVRFVEAWGAGLEGGAARDEGLYDDREVGIVEAARQSTQGNFVSWEPYEGHPKGDRGLLRHLYRSKHLTPFEFAGLVLEIQAPLFVFREWHRHRTQSYNEMSARYAPLPDLYYTPTVDAIMDRARIAAESRNRQEKAVEGAPTLERADAVSWWMMLATFYGNAERVYQLALKAGIPKEMARITMPVGHYSRMRASTNLRNWIQFLSLRTDPAAQWEIRQYAVAVAEIVSSVFPETAALAQEDNYGRG